jgi:hypothetical protein
VARPVAPGEDFTHPTRGPIMLHKPHPDETLKAYQVTQIITFLKVERLI